MQVIHLLVYSWLLDHNLYEVHFSNLFQNCINHFMDEVVQKEESTEFS